MTCAEVSSLLPWLLNGTLSEDEAVRVREHLRECADCRRELVATRAGAELFGTHLPAADLVAHAFGRAPAGLSPAEVEAHLDLCPECRRELALVREDPSAAEHGSIGERQASDERSARAPLARRDVGKRHWWPAGPALAAGLAVAALGGYWWPHRVAPQPAADLVLLEFQPSGHVLRGGDAPASTVSSAKPVLLLLATDDVTPYAAYRLEVRGARGELVWHSDSVRRQEAGDFVLHLPAGLLPPGRAEVRLLARQEERWRPLESYTLRVVP